ncbi:hypothetical protein SS50377_22681 [Spironucleus salmonicida]|uniref:Uncharacterized protein n=1 Tax=Spironucleus salmonicida TaxID=348837 RepID=V6LZ36_9EUKA|nr:hypothetical protein SS50377_22681 [Spironucleus salmonicida]|eukprot:EST49001.1 Hypothetical protein SS50377_10771 [Spironucleus salmonicida]
MASLTSQIHELTIKIQLTLNQQTQQAKLINILSKSSEHLQKQLSKTKNTVTSNDQIGQYISAREAVEQLNGANFSEFVKELEKFIKQSFSELKNLQKQNKKSEDLVQKAQKKLTQQVVVLEKLENQIIKLAEDPKIESIKTQKESKEIEVNACKDMLAQQQLSLQDFEKSFYEQLEAMLLQITEYEKQIILILSDTQNLTQYQSKMLEINQFAEGMDVKGMALEMTRSLCDSKEVDEKSSKQEEKPIKQEEQIKEEVKVEEKKDKKSKKNKHNKQEIKNEIADEKVEETFEKVKEPSDKVKEQSVIEEQEVAEAIKAEDLE